MTHSRHTCTCTCTCHLVECVVGGPTHLRFASVGPIPQAPSQPPSLRFGGFPWSSLPTDRHGRTTYVSCPSHNRNKFGNTAASGANPTARAIHVGPIVIQSNARGTRPAQIRWDERRQKEGRPHGSKMKVLIEREKVILSGSIQCQPLSDSEKWTCRMHKETNKRNQQLRTSSSEHWNPRLMAPPPERRISSCIYMCA